MSAVLRLTPSKLARSKGRFVLGIRNSIADISDAQARELCQELQTASSNCISQRSIVVGKVGKRLAGGALHALKKQRRRGPEQQQRRHCAPKCSIDGVVKAGTKSRVGDLIVILQKAHECRP